MELIPVLTCWGIVFAVCAVGLLVTANGGNQ